MDPVSIVLPGGTKNGPNGSNRFTLIFTFLFGKKMFVFENILVQYVIS